MNVTCRILAAIGAVLAVATQAGAQTNVVMRPGAAARAGEPVRISDVAALEGPDAGRLADVVVLDKAVGEPNGIAAVTASQVHAAAERAVPGLNWGRVTISGGTCYVRVGPGAERAPEPAKPAREHEAPAPIDSSDGSVRAEVTHRLASLYGVEPAGIRVGFSGLSAGDQAFLNRPLQAGVRYEVQPAASARSGRVPLRVDVYRGDRLAESRTLNADVLVKRSVVVASMTIERDAVVTADAVTGEERWLTPDAPAGLTTEQAVGATARRRVDAGRVVTAADVQTPVVVRKGETVWVHCLSGSMVVKVRAKALADGRDGQEVPMQVEGSKKTFTARMSGRGTAVMLLDDRSADADRREPDDRGPTTGRSSGRVPVRGAR